MAPVLLRLSSENQPSVLVPEIRAYVQVLP